MSIRHVTIIAEAGVNHNGDLNKAKALIDVAADAGADYVKFQSFRADKLVSPTAKKAAYQSRNTSGEDDSQFQMLKKLELSADAHLELIGYCRTRNIRFLSSPFDPDGVRYLDQIGMEVFKIPSGEITNSPYLQAVAQTGKPVILSTGVSTLEEVKKAVQVLTDYGTPKDVVTVLHCNTEYPTPMEDVNLKAMNTLGRKLDVRVGYSDHTLGIEVPVAAVALGAAVIEKHFTLDRNLPGPDHASSLEPKELTSMVTAIRNIELALSGDGIKQPSSSELPNKTVIRKSIHAGRKMKKGETISEEDLVMLRPGEGISPMQISEVIGRTVNKTIKAGTLLAWEDLK